MTFTALAVMALPALAQEPQTSPGTDYEEFAELMEGAPAYTGFFDLYERGDELWLAVTPDRLGQDFLMEMKVAQGIGAAGIFGGTMLNSFEGKIMSLERHGERVFLMQRPHRFNGGGDPAVENAVNLTIGSSVVESAEIASIRDDGALVFPVQDWSCPTCRTSAPRSRTPRAATRRSTTT